MGYMPFLLIVKNHFVLDFHQGAVDYSGVGLRAFADSSHVSVTGVAVDTVFDA